MPTKNPRINVVLEKPLYDSVGKLAKEDGVSLSMEIRDLVKVALDLREDVELGEIAEARNKTFRRKEALKHDEVF